MADSAPPHAQLLFELKRQSGLTFAEIAERLGKAEVWTTALFFGQAKTDRDTALRLLSIVDPDRERRGFIDIRLPGAPNSVEIFWEDVLEGLCGNLLGAQGMITRGETAEWPPKVSYISQS